MKKIILVSALFASLSAFAAPKVGDFALYDVTVQSGAQSTTGVVSEEIKAIDATTATIEQISTFNGQTNTQSVPRELSKLASADEALFVVKNCSERNGLNENLVTPAGGFATCHLSSVIDAQTQGHYWIAAVPFGYAQATTQQGDFKTTIILHAFRTGQ